MTCTPLHIVFTPSGAGSLRQALANAGRDDQVISSFDHLGFGPINPLDLLLRSKWVENELGWTGWDGIARDSEQFWREALVPGHRKVAWLSRRSAMEYAGFLEWLWRMGDTPCEVVDLSEVKISRGPEHSPPPPPVLAMSLGILSSDIICRDKLWDLAEPLPPAARERYRYLWQELRSENAPLRVIDGDRLVSAPISFFDTRLMSYVTNDWQKVAMVIGKTLAAEIDDEVLQVGDIVLAARIDAMVESGLLEIQGESALEMHDSLVRLPE
jgi:Protein of unknown function/Domain of unknown function (DUF1835)